MAGLDQPITPIMARSLTPSRRGTVAAAWRASWNRLAAQTRSESRRCPQHRPECACGQDDPGHHVVADRVRLSTEHQATNSRPGLNTRGSRTVMRHLRHPRATICPARLLSELVEDAWPLHRSAARCKSVHQWPTAAALTVPGEGGRSSVAVRVCLPDEQWRGAARPPRRAHLSRAAPAHRGSVTPPSWRRRTRSMSSASLLWRRPCSRRGRQRLTSGRHSYTETQAIAD